ncbi:hypothetical protein MKW94_016319 [Papaver nudicaule]|uniref:Peptidase metallopeptidase domain-containing protein n=1 Tax=Papaver nudicaule TaxID=74823 RepID=A0AA41VTM3_PAPNU|nr:hypothetical protein [Papaver nudicaule]
MDHQKCFSYYMYFFFILFITFPHSIPARNMPATTGRLDSTTQSQVMTPRCGVPDNNGLHTTKHYSLVEGRRTWGHSTPCPTWDHSPPLTLTYALSPTHTIHYLKASDIRAALERAFKRWSSVIPVNFIETQDYKHANIRIGFYNGDHGDGVPFGETVLAHASGPISGNLHFNAGCKWAVDFESEKSEVVFDLESVALHEIGHVLGLGHSSIPEAVMWFGGLTSRTKKLDLTLDDINGAQFLYGVNPNIKLDSLSYLFF